MELNSSTRERLKRAAISAFLLIHIFAITTWSLPLDSPLLVQIRNLIRPYMFLTGLFQSWDMFAPVPATLNAYVNGVVITRDGKLHTWRFPRMEQLSLSQRYSKERYRKFVENLPEDKNSALWPDAARYLARLYNNPANPPEIVLLIRYWTAIAPQAKEPPDPTQERAHIFFEYHLKPEDLK